MDPKDLQAGHTRQIQHTAGSAKFSFGRVDPTDTLEHAGQHVLHGERFHLIQNSRCVSEPVRLQIYENPKEKKTLEHKAGPIVLI
jgi:hypothetical protein